MSACKVDGRSHRGSVACGAQAVSMSAPAAERCGVIVLRWVQAFNARDLDAMLGCVTEQVEFHPLRLGGTATRYRGRDGVREWFERSRQARHAHRIAVREVQDLGAGKVFTSSSLSLGDEADIGPVCGLYQVDRAMIVTAREYLTDPDMIERLGLIP